MEKKPRPTRAERTAIIQALVARLVASTRPVVPVKP
jgi:hypothetical protein